MKRIQQLHLWLGTLFAPLIIFFSLSGALQTLGWHELEHSGGSTPAWIAQIASIHKNQRLQGGERPRPALGKDAAQGASGASTEKVRAPRQEGGPRPEGALQQGASPRRGRSRFSWC